MLETSKDLFYVVLSFCILWLTVFLCWALYYTIRMLKQTNELLAMVKHRIERVTNLVNFLKSKMVEVGMKGVMSLISSFTGSSKTSKTSKTSKNNK